MAYKNTKKQKKHVRVLHKPLKDILRREKKAKEYRKVIDEMLNNKKE